MEPQEGGGSNKKDEERLNIMVCAGDSFQSVWEELVKYKVNPIHQQSQNRINSVKKIVKLMGLFAAVSVASVVLYHSTDSFRSFAPSYFTFFSPSPSPSINSTELIELEKVLEKAAMVDGTVIVTTLNEAWAAPNSIFELFLESFKIGNQTKWLLNHLVVVALDQHAYDLCLNLHSNCYLLKNVGSSFSSEAYFMSSEYLKMMWKRIDFLHQVLNMGYNFVFTDVDIMWFRDPFPHFFEEADFQIACDYYRGDPSNINNSPNGGFNYVKSNKKTIKFYEFWYKSKNAYPGMHDQDVLNRIKHDPYIKKIGLEIKFLDTAYFGGFCQPSKDLNIVVTMHANCCVGLDNKIYDLKTMLEDWRKYVTNSTSQASSWTVPQHCGAASFGHRKKKRIHDVASFPLIWRCCSSFKINTSF